MVRQFKSVEHFQRAMLKRPMELLRFNVSPGWVGMMLGVSRQRVSDMIRQGVLDAVRTDDGIVLLRKAEVLAYKRLMAAADKHTKPKLGMLWKQDKSTFDVQIRKREEGLLTKLVASFTLRGSPDDVSAAANDDAK